MSHGKWCSRPGCGQISYDPSGLCGGHADDPSEPMQTPVYIAPETESVQTFPDIVYRDIEVRQAESLGLSAADFAAMFLPQPKA
jgi:hypothetical protein